MRNVCAIIWVQHYMGYLDVTRRIEISVCVRTRCAVSLRPCPLRLSHVSCAVVCYASFIWFLKITCVTSMDNQYIEILRVNSSLDNVFVLLVRIVQLHKLLLLRARKPG